ncbi:MAG: hypothetical protein ACREP7_04775 [Lysobacter sp.]
MDENLDYLLHEELEGLFDPPATQASHPPGEASPEVSGSPASPERITAPIPAAADAAADSADATIDALIERLSDPKVVQALARLLGVR